MKRCPYCGAAIKSSAATFCPKCKKPLKKPVKANGSSPGKSPQNVQPSANTNSYPPVKQTHKNKIFPPRKNRKTNKKPILAESAPAKNPMDENYDGYYDDQPTDDNAQNKDSFDPELIKRIAMIAGGAVILVILSVILMNLL